MTRFTYLDHGYLEVVGHMGSDRRIAEAAWVSSNRAADRPDSDVARIVKYLARENHWTPFGQTAITLRFRVPIFIARQLMRSNVGIVWNEESRRYVDDTPEFHVPAEWREKSKSMKQGSGGAFKGSVIVWGELSRTMNNSLPHVESPSGVLRHGYYVVKQVYKTLLDAGIAPEQARMVLPVATYTTIVGTFNLASLARVHGLRSGPHAQAEIRELADCIDKAVRSLGVFEVAWGALTGDAARTVERGVDDIVNGKVKESK